MGDLGGGRHPLGGQHRVIDRDVSTPGEVLDRAARQPGAQREPDGLRDAVRIVGEAVLQVGRDRQVGRPGEPRGVR